MRIPCRADTILPASRRLAMAPGGSRRARGSALAAALLAGLLAPAAARADLPEVPETLSPTSLNATGTLGTPPDATDATQTGAAAASQNAGFYPNTYGIPGSFSFPRRSAKADKNDIFTGDFLIVGVGAGFTPQYDGAKHESLLPAVGVMGRIGPVGISPRAAGLALNFLPASDNKVSFALGPVLKYSSNRHNGITDPVVASLGKLPAWWEGGAAASVTVHHILDPYDAISFASDFRWDISGHGVGRTISPSIGYYTPVSKGIMIAASGFAEFVDRKYAQFNYSISPEQSLVSGLPAYSAHGGAREWGAQAAAVIDFDGNLLDGGWAAIVGASYSRLVGSAADTPITAIRGTANQLTVGLGISYAFRLGKRQ